MADSGVAICKDVLAGPASPLVFGGHELGDPAILITDSEPALSGSWLALSLESKQKEKSTIMLLRLAAFFTPCHYSLALATPRGAPKVDEK